MQSITKSDIEGVVKALREGTSEMGTWNAPTKLKGKKVRAKWAATSINPMLARLRSIFADLMAQGIVARNPAALVKALPATKKKLTTLDAGQVAELLTATASHPLGIAVQLADDGRRRQLPVYTERIGHGITLRGR